MKIVPLREKYLEQAIALCNKVFPGDVDSNNTPELGFKASLDKEKYNNFWNKYQCTRIEYFLLVTDEEKVVGTTGLYEKTDPSTARLGWFCIDPEERGKGYGEKLLKYSIDKAKEYGYSYLELYTDPNELPEAQRLYKKVGFEFDRIGMDPADNNIKVTYLKKTLK